VGAAPEELRGYTITLSNFGMIAGKYASPVVLPPTVAILGSGRRFRAPVAVANMAEIRALIPLWLTFDHRAVIGGEAGRFLAAVITDLQRAG
jgi:pyruvate dehydrogenase E2 component (dihydrolipoamide acetyltransferase)